LPGDELQFFGTLTNTTSGTVYLNADNFNLATLPLSSFDDSPFFANAPVSLDGGGTSGDIELFDLDIPAPFTPGKYDGSFQVLGGVDDNAQDVVGTVNFTVQVQGPTSAIPEPTSLPLLGAAFLGIGWLRGRCASRRNFAG
jgi:hypothetical protein